MTSTTGTKPEHPSPLSAGHDALITWHQQQQTPRAREHRDYLEWVRSL